MAKKKYSINDYAAQLMRNNQNAIELLTKLDQSLNSNESYITAKSVDASGKEVNTQIPTVGFFKQKLDQVTKMVKTMAGLEGNTSSLQISENSFKRIITADINKEPNQISQLQPVSTFKTDPNWIFDSFLNPLISVEIDLTGRVDINTRTILSKRFIVKFDKIISFDENDNEIIELTPDAQTRLIEFEQLYKGKNDINIVEFVTWLDSPGLVNRVDDTLIDQDEFKIEPNRIQFKGDFTVLNTELDTVNKKLWYVLDTLTYYDIADLTATPKPIDLKIGDLIKVNPIEAGASSATVYRVVEISTITSQYRVRFEQVFGQEPIPVKINAISIYSEVVPTRSVRVSVGFDEYCVLFLKQIDDFNNIVGLDWSTGIGFYTNELRLDNETGELFSDYYVNTVYDYGVVLQDLVAKKVPNYYGIKPNAPVLDDTNFKVVQINSHLTQTVEAEKIRDLHNEKNNLISQISQIQTSIEKQNRLISTTNFTSNADKKRADDQLVGLLSKLDAKNKSKATIITDIIASKKNLNRIAPIFHLRGFFPMPEAKQNTKTKPQEIVQFEIWYRKLSKSGDENPILTITDINNLAAQTASETNTTASNIKKPKVVNGTFSNWQKYKTDSRKRSQDPITGDWYWVIEDVTDANTPNINQVDIPILPGERIEIKIKSLSEVGWPETPVESDFSNTLTYDFPDDLNNVLNEDEFILKEAQADDMKVSFERELEARGLNLHLSTALRDSDIYYAHKADAIASGFRDNNGKIINLYDQLLSMVQQINTLQETINRSKGILEIYLINKGNRTKLFSGNNLSFNINLEDYMTPTKIGLTNNPVDSIARTYKNELILIDDFQLLIKNAAETSDLGILSYRGYGQPNGKQPSIFAYNHKGLTGTSPIAQPIWITANSEIQMQEIADNNNPGIDAVTAPRFATQQNNQWIWLQAGDLSGDDIYYNVPTQTTNNFWDYGALGQITNGASDIIEAFTDKLKNLGFTAKNLGPQTQTAAGTPAKTIIDNRNWQINENPESSSVTVGKMATTIHPVINGFTDIIDTSSQLIKFIKPGDTNSFTIPIYIYAKPYTGTGVYQWDTGGNPNTSFVDYDVISSSTVWPGSITGGDMPEIAPDPNITKANSTNKLIIKLTATSGNVIKVNDRIILSGVTGVLSDVNGKLLTVTKSGLSSFLQADEIEVNYDATALTNDYGSGLWNNGGSIVIEQLHKRYRGASDGIQLYAYNVLGTVNGDNRYVNNYVEIVSGGTPNPTEHNKKLRFLLEDENNIRPFEFQLTWNIKQYKPTVILGTTISAKLPGFISGL